MNEQQELKIKNALCAFIRENFVLEGQKDMVDDKIRNLANGLFVLFQDLTKKE